MIWRLTKIVLVLIGVTGMLTGAAATLARDNSPSVRLSIYGLDSQPDCVMPCWIGIHSKAFSVPAAKTNVEKAFGASPVFRILLDDTAPEDVLRFLLVDRTSGQRNGPLIRISKQSIIINFQYAYPALRPTVADIYNWLGEPSYITHPQVTAQKGQYFYQFVYAGDGYTLYMSSISSQRIAPDTLVDSFVIMYTDVKHLYEIEAYSMMLRIGADWSSPHAN
jgi:hypothetical protein